MFYLACSNTWQLLWELQLLHRAFFHEEVPRTKLKERDLRSHFFCFLLEQLRGKESFPWLLLQQLGVEESFPWFLLEQLRAYVIVLPQVESERCQSLLHLIISLIFSPISSTLPFLLPCPHFFVFEELTDRSRDFSKGLHHTVYHLLSFKLLQTLCILKNQD